MQAKPSWFKLLAQEMRSAASRTFCTAGISSPIKMAMMAMTTSSSISVNADLAALKLRRMTASFRDMSERRDKELTFSHTRLSRERQGKKEDIAGIVRKD